MLIRVVAQFTAVLLLGLGWAGTASALPVGGPGLDAGGACPQSGSTCAPVDYDFAVTPAPATGTIDFTGGPAIWSIDISLGVASLTMEDTTGAIDGVDKIVFTNLTFDVVGWSAFTAGDITAFATTGTVAGTYEQFLGATSVGGPTNFGPVNAGFGALACNASLTGQCGFTVGIAPPELDLNVGTTGGGSPYEFAWTFNVTVPEPSTASLLGLGLVGLATSRRRRA